MLTFLKQLSFEVRVAALCFLVLLAHLLISFIDLTVADAANHAEPGYHAVFRWISNFGDSKWYLIPTGVLGPGLLIGARWAPDRHYARLMTWLGAALLFVFAAIALSGILNDVIKVIVGRARPSQLERFGGPDFSLLAFKAGYQSFPSGHSNTAVALALAVGFLVRRSRLVLYPIAVTICLSRVIVASHFVTDVVGGAALAVIVTYLLRAWFARRGYVFALAPDGHHCIRREGVALAALIRRTTRTAFRSARGRLIRAGG